MNVLISSSGRRNVLIDLFKGVQDFSEIHCADIDWFAPSIEKADYSHISLEYADKNYVKELKKICDDNDISLLLSVNDFELPIISKNKSFLESNGMKVLVSNYDVIEICFNKTKSQGFLKTNGFLVPESYQSLEDVQLHNFPIIIKPRFGTASIGVESCTNFEELKLYYSYCQHKLNQSSIVKHVEKGDQLLIQQKVQGEEYAVDIINDFNGKYQGSVIKRKLNIRDGDAAVVITEKNQRIEEFALQLANKLRHVGNLDVDLVVNEEGIYCVDLNPRFGGAYPFSHLSGLNLPLLISKWMKGESTEGYFEYLEGIVSARTENYLVLEKYKKLQNK